jgi:hypothetical protein
MMNKPNAWDATSWDALQKLTSLEDVKAALWQRERNRVSQKKCNLKRQLLLAKAKAAGITLDD